MATIDEIKQQAEAVKNATQLGENTAVRVGGVLVDLANKAKELEDNIETKADSTETKNKFDAIDRKNKEQDTAIGMKFDSSNVSQELGSSEKKVPSQKLVTEKFKEETARVNAELGKKANAEEVDSSLEELQNTVFPLQVSLSLDKTLLEYTGSEQSIKATYSIKRKGSPVTPIALALYVDGSLVSIDVKQADTVTIKVNKEGETQIILTAKHGDLVKSASSKVTMVLPIYYGFGTTETDIAIAANKLSPCLSASGTYAKTSAKDDVNFIILAPKTLPKLNNFTMGGAPFVMETSSVSINGKDYYMYKSGGIYMNGTEVKVQAS